MAISGKTGVVTVGGSTLCAHEWTLNLEKDLLESTDFCSDGWKEFILGLKGATGSIATYDRASGVTDPVEVTLANDDVTFSGSAFLTESVTTPVAEKVEYTYDVTFTGEVTEA